MAGKNKNRNLSQTGDTLHQQREKAIQKILRFKTACEEKTISLNPNEIECRLEILNLYINEAMEIQNELDREETQVELRTELEDLCVSTKALYLTILNKRKKNHAQESVASGAHVSQTKLPHMKLPKFSGKYSEFKNFIGLFDSLVDDDPNLSNVEKFNHLLSCLTDDALGTIKAYQVTDNNYSKALSSLKLVYDNKCLIFFEHISKLFSLPATTTPSASGVRSLVDTVSAIYGSLLSIGDDTAITNAILIQIVMSKIDPTTRSKWEESIDYDELPTWEECKAMLNKRYQVLSADEASKPKPKENKNDNKKGSRTNVNSALACAKDSNTEQSASKSEKCLYCKSPDHWISTCSSFSNIPVSDRFQFSKSSSLCLNCLRKGHSVKNCRSSKCRICQKPHHTTLHIFETTSNQSSGPVATASVALEKPSTAALNAHSENLGDDDQVILATAVVYVLSKTGELILARALLDSASQTNFITEELCQKLNLKKEKSVLNLVGIGRSTAASYSKTNVVVRSRVNSYEYSSKFWVLRSISSHQPMRFVPPSCVPIPNNLQLADPQFNTPQKIDLLIGAESFFDVLCVGQIKSAPNIPILQKTLFGWIISGKYQSKNSHTAEASSFINTIDETDTLNATLEKFWEMEEVPKERSSPLHTSEQCMCENHFVEHVKRVPSGRFQVSLPFKSSPNLLGQSYETAKRRFESLERRIVKSPEIYNMYLEFMKEYIQLGHMSLFTEKLPNIHYFIPHQCVLRPLSTSTKLRVVFDASAKTSSNISLNEILMKGPTIQPELYDTLLRFRMNKYALTADISKMYRQVEIADQDRKFQLILWRESSSQHIQIYKLNTVTYGTTPAPFLAIRCLTYLSELYKNSHSVGSKIIQNSFYVDDLLSGADSIEELSTIRKEVTEILQFGGFPLAKWFSNHNPAENSDRQIRINEDDSTKTLGIRWLPKEDVFKFTFEKLPRCQATKRSILSISSKLFDPLGLLSPFIIKAKVLLQELWLKKVDWDESIPIHLNTRWEKFLSDLDQLDLVSIPRFVNTFKKSSCEIHGFADASSRAYGCCIYIRSQIQQHFKVRLLTAKSKVAPLKSKSLPRLELCAAHLLSKLWNRIEPLVDCHIDQIYFWTDSEITLHWLRNHPSSLSVFVANRVSELQDWTKNVSWRHVPSKDNPADIVSRGCEIDELTKSIWFTGPQFLLKESTCWPQNCRFALTKEQEELEKRKEKFIFVSVTKEENYILKVISTFSSYSKLLRVFAYIFRWLYRTPKDKLLTSKELHITFLKLVSVIQQCEYAGEIHKLQNSNLLSPRIQKLNPFLHEFKEGKAQFWLLRVGGRLLNAPLPYNAKFPLLLPKNCYFVELYLKYLHISNCHAGAKALMAFLRQNVWLVNARKACTKTVRSCIHCFRYKPKLLTQIMGNLPADRLTAARPFLICGVDFCGPVHVTLKIRGKPPVKMYIAVYVCFASKAVHLELVSNLSSDCFILSLIRFTGRRGLPTRIYCDNGTNFVGANRELSDLIKAFNDQKAKLSSHAAKMGTEFVFIPPRAPHFGGLWEAAVKSAKHRLLRAIGSALLTQEELATLLVDVEAVLNSRPIAPSSNDPNDGVAITPAHLLVGQTLRPLLPESTTNEQASKWSYSRRWQTICELKRRFWKDWSRDYILSLQQRNKWAEEHPNVAIGDLVIVQDENLPPQQWHVGRVITVVQGSDNKVRVATVRTKAGEFKRPIHRLALLPLS